MTTASRETAEAFNLYALTPEYLEDPFPVYHALREHSPVHRLPDGSVFLSRYADVIACYRDRTMSSDKRREFGPKFGEGPLLVHHTTSLVFNDPPLHTRVRKLLAQAFTPRAMRSMEPGIVALVDGFLDRAEERGEMDLIGDFAFALPVGVICDMLGVPAADRERLRDWAMLILGALEPTISDEQLRRGNEAVAAFSAYLKDLIDERRRNPGEGDILSILIAGEVDGERLSEEELIQNCIFLLNAGHETTTNLIGNGVAGLLAFPGEMARLRADPDLMDSAIEEFLRFESSNQLGTRRATRRVEFDGGAVEADTVIHLGIGAANRDPAVFPDPDRLDITREPNRHLAFGWGAHICLGNSLARMEGKIAIGRLLARFRHIERNGDFVRGGRARFRGYRKFPVKLR
ncbi:cytochrome P450 [Minwuia thermotolerans]|uniref:Cytochrome P450 n=1 Tax=Minwuia thermotolerans TaxID=2056226 RepID=A0A2M9G7A4_9PROT|nr:cytochrome P450 [Minwuia thermotolerans]PJK31599.1 cytochrome P450 [Minwuia thermotolerans]